MKNTDLIKEGVETIARLIQQRKVSPVEVIEAHLDRIERLNPKLNAIVTLAPDVMERARDAEAAVMRGETLGSLHGVPITVKDTIETAGLRTTSGSKMRSDYIPKHDAPAVARLKAEGAIILGKTNPAEMAMDYTADNPVFGRTNHPLNNDLTPGGSSGGEAVAIATGMSPGGLGSDLAGSVRIPAHFCGICGLKPTTGRVPGEGQFPPSTGPYSLGAVIGPMARTVRDLLGLLAVLGEEWYLGGMGQLPGSRVAWYTDDGVAPVTEETSRAVAAAARALSDAGLIVEERRPPHVERGNEMWLKLFSRASVVQLRKVYEGRECEGGPFVSWRLRTADDTPPPAMDEYIAAWMERDRLREELLRWMETTPLIVAPVGATPAYSHDTLKVTVRDTTMGTFRAFSYAQTFNVFDLPVVTLPAGRSKEGLPIGVQIAGPPFAEEMILAAAEIVEAALSADSDI
ncbi:MAG TPA: amidase [Pyrinomonadaceae bacterium]|nr:amidase [Pyrinomonadaceae bacterium]